MRSICFLITLIFIVLLTLTSQAQSLDTKKSDSIGKAYAKIWSSWAVDKRPGSEQEAAIAQDFKVLAATDFYAACNALIGAKKLKATRMTTIMKLLGKPLEKGVKAYSKFIIDSYLYRKGERAKPTYPPTIPRPSQPWSGLEALRAPLRVGATSAPVKNQAKTKRSRKPKFVLWEAIYSRTGRRDRSPVAYIGGYFASGDRYLLLGTYRPMDSGPYSGKPNDRYVSADVVEQNYVRSQPITYMCPGCEGRQKRDVGRHISMSRRSNKDRIMVHKNQALNRVDCGDCLGRGWGTLYSIKRR